MSGWQTLWRRKKVWVAGLLSALAVLMVGPALPATAGDPQNPFEDPQLPVVPCALDANDFGFLGLPTWYKYLPTGESITGSDGQTVCRPTITTYNDIWLIAAAILEIIIRLSGVVAVGFIIWGGFQYIMSQGASDRLANARNVLINAVTGLVIVIFATRLIGFIAARFAGNAEAQFLLPQVDLGNAAVTTGLNLAFQFAAILAVIFIIIGGITLSRSDGDSSAVQRGKQMIIYALAGLAITLFAQAIVQFVLTRI